MMLIGVTGMPGSGKSTFSDLISRFSGIRLDLDQFGHLVLLKEKVIKQLIDTFGKGIIDESGQISRPNLAKAVFEAKRQAELNAICHPEIKKMLSSELEKPIEFGRYRVLDAALIFEAGLEDLCDFTIFLESSFETRLNRVQKSRSWDEKELRNRDHAQNESLKTERADLIISGEVNLSSLESLACRLDIAFRYHLATGIQLSHLEKFSRE